MATVISHTGEELSQLLGDIEAIKQKGQYFGFSNEDKRKLEELEGRWKLVISPICDNGRPDACCD